MVGHLRLLAAKIEDANLGVGDTTVEPRLRIRLMQQLAKLTQEIEATEVQQQSSVPSPSQLLHFPKSSSSSFSDLVG